MADKAPVERPRHLEEEGASLLERILSLKEHL
jgi:hypothetical protein